MVLDGNAGVPGLVRQPSRRSAIDPFIVMDVMRAANARDAHAARQGSPASERVIHMEVGQPGTAAPKFAQEAALRAMRNIPSALLSTHTAAVLWLETELAAPGQLPTRIPSTFERELVYNIEHTIHHLALIAIGFRAYFPHVSLSEHFGVASSTVAHQKKAVECAL